MGVIGKLSACNRVYSISGMRGFLLVSAFVYMGPVLGGVITTKHDTKERRDVCTTPECKAAAADIMATMDVEAEPCEDFYRFACGGWMDVNEIPDGKSKWGRFYEVRDKVDTALRAIVTSSSSSPSTAVNSLRTMYKGCMDTNAIESAGLDGVLSVMGPDGVDGGWPMVLDTWHQAKFDASLVMGKMRNALQINVLLSIRVSLDDFNTKQNVIYVDQPELGLPLSMYLDHSSYSTYIAAYKKFMVDTARVLVRELGSSVTEETLSKTADAIFLLETAVAKTMTPESERRNSTAMYNPMLVSELKQNYGKLNWDKYLGAVFQETDIQVQDTERVIVVQPDYLENAQQIDTDLETIANYLHWRTYMDIAGELTQELRDIAFSFKSVMSGVSQEPPRWQTCTSEAVGAFGFAAAHEYIKTNFAEESKKQADKMVEDLRAAFKELVTDVDWMDADTQTKAQEKAEQMLQLIGFPSWLSDPVSVDEYFSKVPTPSLDDHLGNMVGTSNWRAIKDLSTLRTEPKRDIWLSHPAIVNAWYSPNHNTITFPAGILQPPFFQGGLPRYLNYGAMGTVIGHEITHGFDDQGRQYDGTAKIAPWWSQDTVQAFSGRAQCFIDEYGNYTLPELVPVLGEEGAHLNGKLTQGENIADNGGIRESFRAYVNSVVDQGPEPSLPGLTQFSPEQMFFISFSQVWCEIQTTEALLDQVLNNPHSPGKFRVIGPLGNSEDFQTAFACSPDSPMNREDKCKLW